MSNTCISRTLCLHTTNEDTLLLLFVPGCCKYQGYYALFPSILPTSRCFLWYQNSSKLPNPLCCVKQDVVGWWCRQSCSCSGVGRCPVWGILTVNTILVLLSIFFRRGWMPPHLAPPLGSYATEHLLYVVDANMHVHRMSGRAEAIYCMSQQFRSSLPCTNSSTEMIKTTCCSGSDTAPSPSLFPFAAAWEHQVWRGRRHRGHRGRSGSLLEERRRRVWKRWRGWRKRQAQANSQSSAKGQWSLSGAG